MDYDKIEDLERFALAADTNARSNLVASLKAAATPGQVFLLGLHSLEVGDLGTAEQCMEQLNTMRSHTYAQEMEARLQLCRWNSDPSKTTTWLKQKLGLSFNDKPPSGVVAHEANVSSQAGPPLLPSSMEESQYSLTAFIECALTKSLNDLAIFFRPAAYKAIHQYLRISCNTPTAKAMPSFETAVLSCPMLMPCQLGEDTFLQILSARLSDRQAVDLNPAFARLGLEQLQKLGESLPWMKHQAGWQAACVRKLYPTSWTCEPSKAPRVEKMAFLCRVNEFLDSLSQQGVPEYSLAWIKLRLLHALAGMQASGPTGLIDPFTLSALLKYKVMDCLVSSGTAVHSNVYGTLARAAFVDQLRTQIEGQRSATFGGDHSWSPMSGLNQDLGSLLPHPKPLDLEEKLVELLAASNDAQGLLDRGPTTALALPPKPSPGYDRLADGLACHSLVVCDLCRSHPIIGVRYRSTSVHDFDVCQACVGTEQALSTGPYQQVGEWVDPRGVLHGLLDTTLEAKLLAKSQLLSGKADDAHWADMYRKAGGDVGALMERVDLQLCGDNPHCMEDAGGDLSSPVMLNVMTKNITTLTVKVYELQPWNYFKTCNGRDMDLGIDLEGLGTTMELVVACAAEGQSRMVWNKRRLDLPQLQGKRGVFAIDLIGGGKQSRALVRRGYLNHIERFSVAGHAITVMYEDGSVVKNARVMVGSKEYLADSATGEVRIPYRSPHAKGPSHLVLGDSHGFAAVVKNWTHMNEQFSLSVGFHLEREACTAGSHAPLVIRPALTANGWPAPLAMLKDVQLVISTQDSSGTRTKQTVNDFELGDGVQAVVHSVLIPERCVQVDCLLSARVRKVHPGQDGGVEYQDLSEGKSFALGGREMSMGGRTTCEPHMSMMADGRYCIRVLGRAGEPIPRVTVQVEMRHILGEAACPSVQKSLMTDTNGELHLGSLAGITRLTAICSDLPHSQDAPPPVTWMLTLNGLPQRSMPPSMVVAYSADSPLCVPYPWTQQQGLSLQENEFVCLLEFNDRMKETVRDVTSLYVSNMEQPKGHLVLRGLPPGTYLLAAPATRGVGEGDQLMTLTVVQPLASGGGGGILTRGTQRYVIGRHMVALLPETKPLQITAASASTTEGIKVQVDGSKDELGATSLHITLTRFVPAMTEGEVPTPLRGVPEVSPPSLNSGTTSLVQATNQFQSNRAIGDEIRYVLERRQVVRSGKVRPGVMLPRPSLLSHARLASSTQTSAEVVKAGEEFYQCADPSRGWREQNELMRGGTTAHFKSMKKAVHQGVMHQSSPPGLSFCPQAIVLPNVPVDPQSGTAIITAQQLSQLMGQGWDMTTSGHTMMLATAVSLKSGSASEVSVPVVGSRDPASAPVIDKMLQRPFPAGTACMETTNSVALPPGQSLVVADAPSATLKLITSLSSMWSMFGALLAVDSRDHKANSQWPKFKFLGAWGALPKEAKLSSYAEHACREFEFLLMKQDREIFQEVCLPILKSKLATSLTFLDSWMLAAADMWSSNPTPTSAFEQLYLQWHTPQQYRTLNSLERVLLAACTPGGAASSAAALYRLAADMKAVIKERGRGDVARQRKRLETALTAGEDAVDSVPDPTFRVGGGGGAKMGRRMLGAAPPGGERFGAVGSTPYGPSGAGPPMMAMAMMAGPPPPAPQGDSSGRDDEDDDVGAEYGEEEIEGGAVMAADMQALDTLIATPAFKPLLDTKQWRESGWFEMSDLDVARSPTLVAGDSLYWCDYALYLAVQPDPVAAAVGESGTTGPACPTPFVPGHAELAGETFHDAVLGLAVMGLPWSDAANRPTSVVDGTRLTVSATPTVPLVTYVKQTKSANLASSTGGTGGSTAKVVLLQSIIDPSIQSSHSEDDDDDDDDGGDGDGDGNGAGGDAGRRGRRSNEVIGQLLAGKVYALQVTITSSVMAQQQLDISMQAPQGSVTMCGQPSIWTSPIHLPPFGTQQLQLLFYFPHAGSTFANFPAAASRRGKLVAAALNVATTLQVVVSLPAGMRPNAGPPSWRELCSAPRSPASDAALLAYLAQTNDIQQQDMSLVRWHLHDLTFYVATCDTLRSRSWWPQSVWEFSIYHNHTPTMAEFLSSNHFVLNQVGPVAVLPPLLVKEPWQGGFEHMEFFPLVNPRSHALGGHTKVVLNKEMQQQWKALLALLVRYPKPNMEQLLQAVCMLLAMDRYDDAEAVLSMAQQLQQVEPSQLTRAFEMRWTLRYLSMYLLTASPSWLTITRATYLASAEKAGEATKQAAAQGDLKWSERWASMRKWMVEVCTATDPDIIRGSTLTTEPTEAIQPPALSLLEDESTRGGTLMVDCTSIKQLSVSIHEMDVELLFSTRPFASLAGGLDQGSTKSKGSSSNFSFVRPNLSLQIDLTEGAPRPAGVTVTTAPGVPCPGNNPPLRVSIDFSAAFPTLQPAASVMLEVAGSGISVQHAMYRSQLAVRCFEQQGMLQVTDRQTGRPEPSAYVKVFSSQSSRLSVAKFRKDGYTDLMGRFDYFTLSTGSSGTAQKLAVLVSHPKMGSLVRFPSPPPH